MALTSDMAELTSDSPLLNWLTLFNDTETEMAHSQRRYVTHRTSPHSFPDDCLICTYLCMDQRAHVIFNVKKCLTEEKVEFTC